MSRYRDQSDFLVGIRRVLLSVFVRHREGGGKAVVALGLIILILTPILLEIGIVVPGGHRNTRRGSSTFLASSSLLLIASPRAVTGGGRFPCSNPQRATSVASLWSYAFFGTNWYTLKVSTFVASFL